MEQHH